MGTGFKGNSPTYRTIGENISDVSKNYNFSKGYFGENSPHGKEPTRNISSDDALKTAKDFYDRLAYGGMEDKVSGNMSITRMADGTIITMRKVSHSDGTPAIDINIEKSSGAGGIKRQKIHFVEDN